MHLQIRSSKQTREREREIITYIKREILKEIFAPGSRYKNSTHKKNVDNKLENQISLNMYYIDYFIDYNFPFLTLKKNSIKKNARVVILLVISGKD